MNTLLFLCGMGAGALLATILMILVLIFSLRSNKAMQTRNAAHMKRTEELMVERNRTDLRLANAAEEQNRLTKLAISSQEF